MPLTSEKIRDRSFLLGGITQIKKALSDEFSSIKNSIESFAIKNVFKVSVNNFPELTTYKDDLKSLGKGLDKVIGSLKELVDKENPKEITELTKMSDLIKAVESIEIPKAEKIDFSRLESSLKDVEKAIKSIKPAKDVDFAGVIKAINELKKEVSSIEIPETKETVVDNKEIVKELRQLQLAIVGSMSKTTPQANEVNLQPLVDKLDKVIESITKIPAPVIPDIKFPTVIDVGNFPPQKIPQPVTNININPLRGIVHSTSTTITTSASGLPGYGVLEGRRAIVFYNTSATITVYIGGSTVTSANGLPVPPQSYSPSFDSGPLQVWYGVTASGSADVRTIELQNDSGG